MTIRFVVSVAALVGLTACGGGGANLGPPGFGDLQTELDQLATRLAGASATSSPEMVVLSAVSTPAVFEGAILLAQEISSTSSGPAYTGDIALTVNFDSGRIQGNAGGFYQSDISLAGDPVGAATLIGGTLEFDGMAFTPGTNAVSIAIDAGSELLIGGANRAIGGTLVGGFSTDASSADLIVLQQGGSGLSVSGGNPDLDARIIAGR